MKDNRRDFIRKAALGSAVMSTGAGFFVSPDNLSKINPGLNDSSGINTASAGQVLTSWKLTFDEAGSEMMLANGPVIIRGRLDFFSGTERWTIGRSRDGVPDRYSLIDLQGNVQGYIVFNQDSGQLQLLCYHRTAQSYTGKISFKGKITFFPGSFTCKTRAESGERVLSLSSGKADSLLNDSLFDPESDTALRLDASELMIETAGVGTYTVMMSGQINESSRSAFTINLEKDYFRNRYVPYYHPLNRERCPKTPSGWMSWNTYFDTATAGDNLAEAKTGQKYLLPFGCEFWHIESWQENSDKLPVSSFYNMDLETSKRKFPKGMKRLADDIRKLGFRPGLWMAPFGTGNKEFYDQHRDWFLHDKDGKAVTCWNGQYTLDPTVPEALEHLKTIFRTASREWGYEYFKIDGMSGRNHGYCAHLYERPEIKARFRDPSCPNPFELCIKAFREGIGEDRVLLACQGHTTGPEVLYADASRIGADIVSPNKPVQWNGVYNQGRCFLNQAFTHNIVMIADPDTLLVNDLTLEEARVSATIIALPGQLTFFGDKLAGLSDERMKILQQTLPVADVRPMSLYPYFSMLPVWNLHVRNKMLGDYNVVALFNWEDKNTTISFTAEELGVDPYSEYTLFEFWTKKNLGTIKEKFAMNVPVHGVRLLAMHKVRPFPQWISSDRHIAQCADEIKEYEWISDSKTIKGRVHLIGTFPLTMRFRLPTGYFLSKAECQGAECSANIEQNDILAINLYADKTGDFQFRIIFRL